MSLPAEAQFKPAWWCRNPHLQTLRPFIFCAAPRPSFRRQRLELDDGDFVDLDWAETSAGHTPIVVIMHGLGGSSQSNYIRRLVACCAGAGWRSVVLHHRGCSGEPNRLARGYHAGDAADIAHVLLWLKEREPETRVFAAGYSLGGSMLLHYLGGDNPLVNAAALVSVPLDLAAGAARMESGISRIYQRHLVASMKALLHKKLPIIKMPFSVGDLAKVQTLREFDDLVTAPMHGFSDANDYYARCSPRQHLASVQTPTLLIHAADDPLTTRDVIPDPEELSDSVRFELSEHGGHCGFIAGNWPFRPVYWAENHITRFFLAQT